MAMLLAKPRLLAEVPNRHKNEILQSYNSLAEEFPSEGEISRLVSLLGESEGVVLEGFAAMALRLFGPKAPRIRRELII